MIDIIWVVVCIVVGGPLIVNPNKILERPGCKVKSPAVIRRLGILVIIIGILQLLI